MIKSESLTFVVQGAIGSDTGNALKSIRKNFSQSKIVLSTWHGSKTDGLDFDYLVLSVDPGAEYNYFYDIEIKNNINRQIISSFNGLKYVSTEYVVKTRSDNVFINSNLLRYISNYRNTNNEFNISKERILVMSNLITMNPNKILKLALHPSDFIVAGLSDDIRNYFDIPLMKNEDLNYFNQNSRPIEWRSFKLLPRFTTEQYIMIENLKKKNIEFRMKDGLDFNNLNIQLTMDLFGDSFCLVPSFYLGLKNNKHPINLTSKSNHIFTFNEWRYLASKRIIYKIFDFEYLYYLVLSCLKIGIKKFL
ncbi:WavE lipopolysaccharide synthesis family protein [Polynucleobacter sphagniphilus]|uniref:WavE lipopolysaccharide synthesis family protein n=1 Tax=Polynucleobacter sphagniphilus TaxID=1743169 RepID=UPI0024732189|nr:WavE lipopolysaccharide synthesis family protein [Polynucleobacter sphagniphilus]MDH6298852.1 hypothetical protein [Polynucleobacter sphagniphilus]